MIIFFILFVSVLSAIYAFYLRSSTYWMRRGIPAVPPRSIFFGSLKDLAQKSYPRMLKYRDWGREYGKTYGVKEGVLNTLVTSDLEMIQEIFIKQFDYFYSRRRVVVGGNLEKDPQVHLFQSRGSRWKRLRNISVPSFSISALKRIRPIVEDSVLNMLRIMDEKHAKGGVFNIHQFYCEYTMDIIGRLVMGQKESMIFNNPRVAVAQSFFLRDFDRPVSYVNLAIPLLGPLTKWCIKKFGNELSEAEDKIMAEMEIEVHKRIEQRESSIEDATKLSSDFLDIFLDCAAEIAVEEKKEFKLSEAQVSKAITVPEVVAQAFVFLAGGFDTTANALGYTSWMLACHTEVMRRCQEEIDEFCCDESISYEDLSNLTYIDAVCKETLRFFPLATNACSRQCMKDTEACGLSVERGTNIQIDAFNLHFDKEIWGDDAEEFKPERWLDADRRVPSHAYIPFGVGPRICIGMRLAMMEEKIALAHILRRFDIVKGTTANELNLYGSLILAPVEVPVKIVARK